MQICAGRERASNTCIGLVGSCNHTFTPSPSSQPRKGYGVGLWQAVEKLRFVDFNERASILHLMFSTGLKLVRRRGLWAQVLQSYICAIVFFAALLIVAPRP